MPAMRDDAAPRRTRLAFAAVLCLCGSPARAFFLGGYRQTIGNENYRGEYGYADFGGALHLRPTFSAYHDDFSSGTYRTLSGRLAYDATHWGLGVTGGGTPVVNGYSNRFFGADATISLTPGMGAPPPRKLYSEEEDEAVQDVKKSSDWGLRRVDLSGAVTRIIHGEKFTNGFFPSSTSLNVYQTDIRGTLRWVLLKNFFSVDWTSSRYNQDLAAVHAQAAQVENLAGLDANVQGFPKSSFNARVDLAMLPRLVPFAGYTRTKFELSQPDLFAYLIGISLDLGYIDLNASYQNLVQAGQPTLHLSSVGAGLRF